MIDIHSHVLPGVDDGSPDMKTSLELLGLAVKSGTTDLVCTPHVLDRTLDWETISQKTRKLQREADNAGINIRLHSGAELEWNAELLDLLKRGHGAYCLGESRYPLIEIPALSMPLHIDDFLYELLVRDFIPVIAHAERHLPLMEKPERLLSWMRQGVLVQMNTGSVTGFFGSRVRENARLLLRNGMVTFVGSDAHNVTRRSTDVREALEEIVRTAGEEYAREITERNPQKLLDNLPVIMKLPDEIKPVKDKKSFWNRLFG